MLPPISEMQLRMSAKEAEKKQKNAAQVRQWRENRDPQLLEEERHKDRVRKRKYRQRPVTDEQKEHELKLAKERNRRYRYVLYVICLKTYIFKKKGGGGDTVSD